MKELTASQITKTAMRLLENNKCFIWRNNNLAVKGRSFIGLKGVPDIVGFQKFTGVAVYCEVKTKSDKFSEYQVNFLNKAKTSGCHCLVAIDQDGEVILKEWPLHE